MITRCHLFHYFMFFVKPFSVFLIFIVSLGLEDDHYLNTMDLTMTISTYWNLFWMRDNKTFSITMFGQRNYVLAVMFSMVHVGVGVVPRSIPGETSQHSIKLILNRRPAWYSRDIRLSGNEYRVRIPTLAWMHCPHFSMWNTYPCTSFRNFREYIFFMVFSKSSSNEFKIDVA